MIRKVLSIGLVIFWMGFIFSFSQSDGQESGRFSKNALVKVIEVFTDFEENSKDMEKLVEKLHFSFRKVAHFTVYFILGFLIMNALLSLGIYKRTVLIAVICAISYAIFDEVHQSFIDGRVGSIADVLLDSSGSCLAIYLFSRFILLRGCNEKGINK